MDKLNALLRPTWGSEKWIEEGWQQITEEEQEFIEERVNELFKDGLPFEIQHDRLFYIYAFSMLAQLEVLAIQVPLKFKSKLSNPLFRQQLHVQLLDEIFHGIVFTKIVYMLCAPYAMPPTYNENIEQLCNFIRNENCPQVALMLLNLIAEGWIEEIFSLMQEKGIAHKVFATILSDERRHISEADLYREIGLPDMDVIKEKLAYIEEQLLTNVFLQYKYNSSFAFLLGVEGSIKFLQSLEKKHSQQLEKINLEPGEGWKLCMRVMREMFPEIQRYAEKNHAIPMSSMRKIYMTQWKNPTDPTMVAEFNLNVSCLDVFNKSFPAHTITTLMLQTVSLLLTKAPEFRYYLSHSKLYKSDETYVGVIAKLPNCGDHLGTIVFENCHCIPVQELFFKIRRILKMMVYCYKKREHLEKNHPELESILNQTIDEMNNGVYPYPMPGNPLMSVSNISHCGYVHVKAPLRINEAGRFTLLDIDRKMVWNKHSKKFEEQDVLPVSISADHRIFDGNKRIPKLMQTCFEQMFEQMIQTSVSEFENKASMDDDKNRELIELIELLLENNLRLGYKVLLCLQTIWMDFINIEQMLSSEFVSELTEITLKDY
ncbi:hypothetical protein E3983_11365 [Legionella israelensis]|uniref:CoA-dependent acyltransferase n=1 Tax=Legionella israelensis TaxID=454 RepID=A0AAX1EJB9_9GAMM|nr:hypothetical protein [Legionella israelensis]QBR84897.1 hypothetical protein E3983_11365 [Legionella israelensis]